MTELTRKCLMLDREKREKLIKTLQQSLAAPEQTDKARFDTLYDIATEMFGRGILSRCRDHNLVLGRTFIIYQLRKENYSFHTIARFLVRDPKSIKYMYQNMEHMRDYPDYYATEMEQWDEFMNKAGMQPINDNNYYGCIL